MAERDFESRRDFVRLDFYRYDKNRKFLKYENRADDFVCSVFYATDLILY